MLAFGSKCQNQGEGVNVCVESYRKENQEDLLRAMILSQLDVVYFGCSETSFLDYDAMATPFLSLSQTAFHPY